MIWLVQIWSHFGKRTAAANSRPVSIIKFEGDKLVHEHIYWDQASVLVQVGLLDPAGLPVAGAETARKVIDKSQLSNQLMARWAESEGQPL
jgi:carboxymethylenebutenolidase